MGRKKQYASKAEKQAAYRERKKVTPPRADVLRNEDKPVKPILRYFGGKWALADWIIDMLPPHRIYVEPYGGSASVLMLKDRSFSEVYNDLDLEVVTLFRVLQNPVTFRDLQHRLKYTPYSRDEFELAYEPSDDPVERARRLMVRSWQGHSSVGAHRKTGFRTNVRYVRRSSPANDWRRLVEHIDLVTSRLQGVVIENRPAEAVITGHDTPETLFYIDPPYPWSTRHDKVYRHEMDDQQHRDLAKLVRGVEGMVIVSGYACDLYDIELFPDWHRITKDHYADHGGDRTEVVWISPAAKAALDRSRAHIQTVLFA